jgi:hypothetical protein
VSIKFIIEVLLTFFFECIMHSLFTLFHFSVETLKFGALFRLLMPRRKRSFHSTLRA